MPSNKTFVVSPIPKKMINSGIQATAGTGIRAVTVGSITGAMRLFIPTTKPRTTPTMLPPTSPASNRAVLINAFQSREPLKSSVQKAIATFDGGGRILVGNHPFLAAISQSARIKQGRIKATSVRLMDRDLGDVCFLGFIGSMFIKLTPCL